MKTIKLILALLMVLFSLYCVSAYDPFFTDYNNFDDGTYNNTFLNGSYIQLAGDNTTGEYYSEIFQGDILGIYTQWYNLSWVGIPFLYGEFPDNQAVEDDANMTDNLLLLHFNETSGIIYDRSGQGYTGIGEVSYNQTGYFNNAFNFDGVDDSLSFSNFANLSLNDSFTLSAWIKTTSTTTQYFINKMNDTGQLEGFGFGKYSSTRNNSLIFTLQCKCGADLVVYGENSINDDNWHNVVAVYDGCRNSSCLNFYIDGQTEPKGMVYVDNITINSTGIDTPKPLFISSRQNVSLHFNGSIDEVAIWNRSLTPTEINDYYLRGSPDINLSVKSCNFYDCSDKNFTLINGSSPEDLNFLDRGNYFQYKADFYTQNTSVSSKLYNVTAYYIRNTSIAEEGLDNTYWDINDSDPTNSTTASFAYYLETLFDGDVNTPWVAQWGLIPRFYFGGFYSGCVFCTGEKLCQDANFIINLTDTYDITRFRTYMHTSNNMAYIWSADRYYNGSWNNINNYTDVKGSGWNEKEWNIEDVDAIRINLEGATSTCGGGAENGVGWFEIELFGYSSINDTIANCGDFQNCVFIDRFNECETDLLETGGWYGQSIACINNSLICNSSDLDQQFYRYFDTIDNTFGDIVLSFSLNIQDENIPLKIDLGYNNEFAIRLKFDDGVIYDNDRNQELMNFDENVEYDYRLFFNLASQKYFLYQDNKRMDLTDQSLQFFNTINNINFVQFVPDLYDPVKNCEWTLDDLSLFGDQALNVTAGAVTRQMVGGIDFANRTAGFDESVCKNNENRHLCFARSVGTDILNHLKNWILGGLILFVVLLIILLIVLMFKHNR